MEKEFATYEQALALKELGFDKPCLKVGNPNGHTMWKWIEVDGEPPTVDINDVVQVHYDENWTQIPTFSQAFRWFRETHKLKFYIREDIWNHWCSVAMILEDSEYTDIGEYETYREAELACLAKLIEIAKVK